MSELRDFHFEPGLLGIFRLFCGAVSAVFFIFAAYPPLLYTSPVNASVWFFMALAYSAVFIYLVIGRLQRVLGPIYLPAAIIATIIIPIVGLSWQPYRPDGPYIELLLSSSYSISILLMFPLIVTAWQYNFRIVTLFFVVLGGIDPIVYLIIGRPSQQSAAAGIYSSLIRIVSFVAIGFVITELMRSQRRRQQQLAEANRKLRRQSRYEKELTITRERNRLAHELHDVLAHTLSGLAVQLEAVRASIPPEQAHLDQMVGKALSNTRSGLRETRRTVRDLRAEPLDELGFQQALTELCRDAERRGGFTVNISYNPLIDIIDSPCEHSLYRIIQEALENVIQHAEAEHVTLRLRPLAAGGTSVTLEDDGVGFDTRQPDAEHHFGISTMQERAAAFGGSCRISSTRGSGTQVNITIPKAGENEERR